LLVERIQERTRYYPSKTYLRARDYLYTVVALLVPLIPRPRTRRRIDRQDSFSSEGADPFHLEKRHKYSLLPTSVYDAPLQHGIDPRCAVLLIWV
jgi:hypothetical protein